METSTLSPRLIGCAGSGTITAVHFAPDVDEYGVGRDGDDGALHRLATGLMALLEFRKYIAEGRIGGHGLGRIGEFGLGHARKNRVFNIVSYCEALERRPRRRFRYDGPLVPPAWRRYVRLQDLVWLLLFAAIAIFSPVRNPILITLLVAVGLVQVLESRIGPKTAIAVNLLLCYPLMYFSEPWPEAINTSYWYILFLPVISASSSFGLLGSASIAVLSAAEYVSLLVYVWSYDRQNEIPVDFPPDEKLLLALRILSMFLVSYATYQLAKAKREEATKYQRAAEQLTAANESLKEAQAEVRRAERLAALGQLTAGLAHELRNPMGTMKTSAEMLARNVEKENAIAREMAGYIKDEVDRTNSLITRFLDFARPQHLKLETNDLAAMLDRVIARLEREKPAQRVYL